MKMKWLVGLMAVAGWGQIPVPPSGVDAAAFNWYRTNGVGASGDLSSSGANKSVIVSPPPKGITTSTPLRIYDGTGSAEVVYPTATTCSVSVPASSCSITFTTTTTHTGSWKIGSATSGIVEAVRTGNYHVRLGAALTLYAPVVIPNGAVGAQYHLEGIARQRSTVTVSTDFPLSADGVFVAEGEPGPIISNLIVSFTQPDSTNLALYTEWPPAFRLQAGRTELHNINIHAAWDGVNAVGHSGGTVIDGMWMSAFNKGIQFDGALDTVRINNFHFWPFGLTTNQHDTFLAEASILGLEIGRVDDFKLTNSLFINRKAIRMWGGATGFGTGIQISNTSFDTYAAVIIEKGNAAINNSYFTAAADATLDQIVVNEGIIQIDNCFFFVAGLVRSIYGNLSASSSVQISNSYFQMLYTDTSAPPIVEMKAETTGPARTMFLMNNNILKRVAGNAFTAAAIYVNNAGGGAIPVTSFLTNNIHIDSAGTTFIKIDADDFHRITGNAFPGSVVSYPATKTNGVYQTDSLLEYGSVMALKFQFSPKAFADLGTAVNGLTYYCTDCTIASPCAGGGTGAYAKGIANAWVCN